MKLVTNKVGCKQYRAVWKLVMTELRWQVGLRVRRQVYEKMNNLLDNRIQWGIKHNIKMIMVNENGK